MQDFRKRRSTKAEWLRMLVGSAGILLLAALAVWSVRSAWSMYQKFTAASDAHAQAQAQLTQLQAQYTRVEAQVAELKTVRGQEGEFRQRYGVALPGEGEIDIVRQAPTSTPGAAEGQNWWQRLWSIFNFL